MPDFCMTDWMRDWNGSMGRPTFPRATNVCSVLWMTSIYPRSVELTKILNFFKNIHRNIKVNCNFCLISQKRKLNCWKLFYKKCYLVITFIGIHNFSPVRLTCQDSRRLWSWWENTLMTVASTTRTHTRGATSTVWRTAPRSIQTPPLTSPNSARGSWGTLLSLEYLTQSKRFGGFPAIFLS